MKKFFLFILLLFLITGDLFSWPVLGMKRENRGLFGFDVVDADLAEFNVNGVIKTGWDLNCWGHGLMWCRKPLGGNALNTDVDATEADEYDYEVAEELVEYSDEETLGGNGSGNYTITRQVSGQSFRRVYTIYWSTLSNGDFDLTVDMTYITN